MSLAPYPPNRKDGLGGQGLYDDVLVDAPYDSAVRYDEARVAGLSDMSHNGVKEV